MKGDFSRDSFDPLRRFSRVLMQQGRVQLDADWNEQVAIQLHFLRRLAADLIGPHGGPGDGFLVQDTAGPNPIKNDFRLSPGGYYVDGWLCENDQPLFYRAARPNRTCTSRRPWRTVGDISPTWMYGNGMSARRRPTGRSRSSAVNRPSCANWRSVDRTRRRARR